MGKKKRLKKPLPLDTLHIKAPSLLNYDIYKPAFSFREMRYRGKGCLSHCDKTAKSSIADKLLELSQLTWQQIHSEPKKGMGYETIPRTQFKIALPSSITPEADLLVFRFSDAGRIAGFRKQDIFHIVAVDSNHNLY